MRRSKKKNEDEPRSIIIWEFRANMVSVSKLRMVVPFALQKQNSQTFFLLWLFFFAFLFFPDKFIHLYPLWHGISRVFIIRLLNRMSISTLLQLLDKNSCEMQNTSEKVNNVFLFSCQLFAYILDAAFVSWGIWRKTKSVQQPIATTMEISKISHERNAYLLWKQNTQPKDSHFHYDTYAF